VSAVAIARTYFAEDERERGGERKKEDEAEGIRLPAKANTRASGCAAFRGLKNDLRQELRAMFGIDCANGRFIMMADMFFEMPK
jgi:hypothetical protein